MCASVKATLYLWCQVPSHEVCMSGAPIKILKKKKNAERKTNIIQFVIYIIQNETINSEEKVRCGRGV